MLFTLSAFEKRKDASYYIDNMDEARALMQGRCRIYEKTEGDNIFIKDTECLAARNLLAQESEFKIRDGLIEELSKIKKNISSFTKIETIEERERYRKFKNSFIQDLIKTENFIILCIEDKERVSQNNIECLAAIDVILDGLEKKKEEDLKEFEKNVHYKDYYRQYFWDNEEEIDKLLKGRCKEVFSDSWYGYDLETQDNECNQAFAEKKRRQELEKISKFEKIDEKKKDLEYYTKNPAEAEKTDSECKQGIQKNVSECEFAANALEIIAEKTKKEEWYENYYRKYLLVARNVIKDCRSGEQKDILKCDTAFKVVNESTLKTKESQEFERYIKYFRENDGKAFKLMEGRCLEYNENNQDIAFEKDIECMAAKDITQEKQIVNDRINLMEELQKLRTKISAGIEIDSIENRARYNNFTDYFTDKQDEAEHFIESCVEDKQRSNQNSIECLASVDVVLKYLNNRQEEYLAKLKQESESEDEYYKYFIENTNEIDKLLKGRRCKAIFSDPWYDYDADIQDKKCNAALEANRRQRMLSKLSKTEEKKEESRGLEYYKKNISEAEKLKEKCNTEENKLSCKYVFQAIEENKKEKVKIKEYESQYKDDLLLARKVMDSCNAGTEKESAKCEIAFKAVNDDIKRRKKEKGFEKYLSYYRNNIDEAKELINKKCDEAKGSNKIALFSNNTVCFAAKEALNEKEVFKKRDLLIDELQNIKSQLSNIVERENDENKLKYNNLTNYFQKKPAEAEEFIASCISNTERINKSKLECLASIDGMLKYLTGARERELKKSDKRKISTDDSRQLAEEDENHDVIMEKRCEVLFSDPWYEYDSEIQDKECNIALRKKQRRLREEKLAILEKRKSEIKDLEYYKQNIAEARELEKRCNEGSEENDLACEYAVTAVEDQLIEEEMRIGYEKYYTDNLLEAKQITEKCRLGEVDNKLQCEIAFSALSKAIKERRKEERFNSYVTHYRANLENARKFVSTDCENITTIVDGEIFVKDVECLAARKVIGEDFAFREKNELIKDLKALEGKIKLQTNFTGESTKSRYKKFSNSFEENFDEAGEFVLLCSSDNDRIQENGVECLAAVDVVLHRLEQGQKEYLAKIEPEENYKDYYRKAFKKDDGKLESFLKGTKCQLLFSDSWYEYDQYIQDKECDAALMEMRRIRKHNQMLAREKEENVVIKNLAYYRDNKSEAGKVSSSCKEGIVENLTECDYALQVSEEIEKGAAKLIEYQKYYEGHIVAAKYHLKWCKSAMTDLNIECKIVDDILKNHVDREINIEKEKKYLTFFRNNPIEAKITAEGICKDKLDDPWYYLDINIRTEKCDAAISAID